MSQPSGRTLPLSPSRRLMGDLAHFARQVPTTAVWRRMRLAAVADARAAADPRPSWCTLFTKAYGMVAVATPSLRQAYLSFPWPRLYQHPINVAMLAVARRIDDEDVVLFAPVGEPEKLGLVALDAAVRSFKDRTVESVGAFRRCLRVGGAPRPFRRLLWRLSLYGAGQARARLFGTFGVTSLGGFGAVAPHPPCVLTGTLSYGVIGGDGGGDVGLIYDPRVFDGATAALALGHLERVLTHEILAELRYLRAIEAA